MTWKLDGKSFRFTHEGAVATITREGSRFYLVVRRNGMLLHDGLYCSLGGAKTRGAKIATGQP